MTQLLRVGIGTREHEVAVADTVLLRQEAKAAPIAEPPLRDRIAAALSEGEHFFAVSDMVVPGDRVAVALDSELPNPAEIVAGVLSVLSRCELGSIEVVVSEWLDEKTIQLLRASLPASVALTIHHLADRDQQSYLAADDDAQPIRISRSLADADFVLPVSVMRSSDATAGGPATDAMFPQLADEGQLLRLQQSTRRSLLRPDPFRNAWAAAQTRQVRWALGVQLALAVEVTRCGQAGRVFAVPVQQDSGPSLERPTPHEPASEVSEVVIACVEGDWTQQTHANLLRATVAAQSHAAPTGTVVLLTDLSALPKPASGDSATQSLDYDADPEDQLHADESPGTEPVMSQAAFACETLHCLINEIDTSRHYLLFSRCDSEAVEAFGFGAIDDLASLGRLVDRHASCRVLRVAQTADDLGEVHGSDASRYSDSADA